MDKINANIPDSAILPLQGPSNLDYLTKLNTYLNTCSASVHSDLGCRTLVHLPLTAPPTVYALLSATTFVVPKNPGSTVQLAKPAPAAAVISALMREHAENLRVCKTYTNTNKVCKQKLLSLVPEVYYCTLKKKHTAYEGVTYLTLLTHLHSKFWRLIIQDIDEIDKRMNSQISGDTEFEAFVQTLRTDRKPWPFKNSTQTSKL